MTLAELKIKNPNLKWNYEPKKDCKTCSGTGVTKKESVCICLFVQHDFCEEAGKMIAECAKKLLMELKS